MNPEREARKAFVRDRQRMVFTITAVLLAVALVVSTLFYTGVLSVGNDAVKAAEAPNHGMVAPCPPLRSQDKDQDGTPQYAQIANNSDVVVRVLNAAEKKTGLAKAVTNALSLRGFSVQEPATYTVNDQQLTVPNTQIRFGVNGIDRAYTVLANFSDAVLVMDNRTDKLVDVLVGNSFDNLVATQSIKQTAGAEIEPIEGCVDASTITDLPATDDHQQVDPPQQAQDQAATDQSQDATDAATDGTTDQTAQ